VRTSGHATPNKIAEVIKTVKPQQAIIPIHTEMGKRFKSLHTGVYSYEEAVIKDDKVFIYER
jgi:ribonuclease J